MPKAKADRKSVNKWTGLRAFVNGIIKSDPNICTILQKNDYALKIDLINLYFNKMFNVNMVLENDILTNFSHSFILSIAGGHGNGHGNGYGHGGSGYGHGGNGYGHGGNGYGHGGNGYGHGGSGYGHGGNGYGHGNNHGTLTLNVFEARAHLWSYQAYSLFIGAIHSSQK